MIIVINENDSHCLWQKVNFTFVKYLTRVKYININNNNQITL